MTSRYADDPAISKEDDKFLDDNNRLSLMHSEVQRMLNFALLRYEENTVRQLADVMIQNIMETVL